MTGIHVYHRPGADRDALLAFIRRAGYEVHIHEDWERLRAAAQGGAHGPAVVQASYLPSGADAARDLGGTPLLLLGEPGAQQPGMVRVSEPYYFSDLQEALETLTASRSPAGPGQPRSAGVTTGEALSPLLRGLAHALNNPLTAAMGWVQLLAADLEESDHRNRTLAQIRRELGRLEQISYALGIIAQRPGEVRGRTDLRVLIEGQVEALREEGLEVALSSPERDLPRVRTDPKALGLVFEMLLVSFLEERSQLRSLALEIELAGTQIIVTVRPEGVALPTDIHPFDLGLLLRDTRHTRALALAAGHAVVAERLGGAVEVFSTPRGDVVRFRVPAAETAR